MEQKRLRAIQDTEKHAEKQRFGLFSQLPPIALGQTNLFKKKNPPQRQNGKVKLQNPNIQVSPGKTGKLTKSLFSMSSFIGINDPYKNTNERMMQLQKKLQKNYNQKQKQVFHPQNSTKQIISMAYEYKAQKCRQRQLKSNRLQNGKVRTQNTNINSNSLSAIQKYLFKHPQYKSEPYDANKLILKKQRLRHHQLIKQSAFKGVTMPLDQFSKPSRLNGKQMQQKLVKHNFHEQAFKPNSGKLNHCFSKYQYRQEGILKKEKSKDKKRECFKPRNAQIISKPSPSISMSKKNLSILKFT